MKRDIKQWPPLISLIKGLLHLGHQVDHYSYYCTRECVSDINADQLNITTASQQPYPGTGSFLKRASSTFRARQGLKKIIQKNNDFDVVWLGEWDYPDIVKIIRSANATCPIIYQLHEYNPSRFKCCSQADQVVVPEENRGWMTFFNADLPKKPWTLPNIPWNHPRKISDELDPTLARLNAEGKKIILYQGTMDLERRCLLELLQAMALLPDNHVLAILPADLTEQVKARMTSEATRLGISQRLFFLQSRIPPKHLDVIGQATIGIGLYRPLNLNQVYCAPNRLYEFAGFGIPVVLPDFPGTSQIAAEYSGVITCKPESPESIANAILSLNDPNAYSGAAKSTNDFYDIEANYLERLKELINKIPAVTSRN